MGHPYDVLEAHAISTPDKIAVNVLKLGDQSFERFEGISWAELLRRVRGYGHYLQNELGLKAGERIAICARNGVEWITLDYACMATGIVSVPLFVHSHVDECNYILDEAEARYIFVDEPIGGIRTEQKRLADVECFIKQKDFSPFKRADRKVGDLSSIIYTSGTSGSPKGVMHSADNFLAAVKVAIREVKITSKDILVSYLPLSHVVERTLIEFAGLVSGATVYFVDRVERMPMLLPEIRPTIFHGVPRIWEMMFSKVERELARNELLQSRLSLLPGFLRNIILGIFIRKKLGLSRLRLAISGAAKLSEEAWTGFAKWGIEIHEGYGLTETCGITTISPLHRPKRGSVGKFYSAVESHFSDDGEICVRAPYHFMGYYKHPDLTQEVLDAHGWFHTGDIGQLDENGYLHITDRKKNLFKTSNGKYVAPQKAENYLKAHPGIKEVLVFGENQAFCVALASVDLETLGSEAHLTMFLQRVNAKLAQHEQVRSLGCSTDEWSPGTGELTPTLKVKRRVIQEKYSKEILALFEGKSKIQYFENSGASVGKERAC